jgi:hypothetical protein
MRRDILLLTEMIDAAEQAQHLTAGVTVSQLETDRQRRDALLWNFTVLGEAAGPLSAEVTIESSRADRCIDLNDHGQFRGRATRWEEGAVGRGRHRSQGQRSGPTRCTTVDGGHLLSGTPLLVSIRKSCEPADVCAGRRDLTRR